MPTSFFGLYRDEGTATADSLFGRRVHYRVLKLPEHGSHERTLMLGCVIALRYPVRLGSFATGLGQRQVQAWSAMPPKGEVSSQHWGCG
jgi:hypothetical protein